MISFYLPYVALAIYIMLLILIPVKIKKFGASEKNEKEKSFWVKHLFSFVLSLAIIVLTMFIHFGTVETVVLEGCSLFGTYIISKEFYNHSEDEE